MGYRRYIDKNGNVQFYDEDTGFPVSEFIRKKLLEAERGIEPQQAQPDTSLNLDRTGYNRLLDYLIKTEGIEPPEMLSTPGKTIGDFPEFARQYIGTKLDELKRIKGDKAVEDAINYAKDVSAIKEAGRGFLSALPGSSLVKDRRTEATEDVLSKSSWSEILANPDKLKQWLAFRTGELGEGAAEFIGLSALTGGFGGIGTKASRAVLNRLRPVLKDLSPVTRSIVGGAARESAKLGAELVPAVAAHNVADIVANVVGGGKDVPKDAKELAEKLIVEPVVSGAIGGTVIGAPVGAVGTVIKTVRGAKRLAKKSDEAISKRIEELVAKQRDISQKVAALNDVIESSKRIPESSIPEEIRKLVGPLDGINTVDDVISRLREHEEFKPKISSEDMTNYLKEVVKRRRPFKPELTQREMELITTKPDWKLAHEIRMARGDTLDERIARAIERIKDVEDIPSLNVLEQKAFWTMPENIVDAERRTIRALIEKRLGIPDASSRGHAATVSATRVLKNMPKLDNIGDIVDYAGVTPVWKSALQRNYHPDLDVWLARAADDVLNKLKLPAAEKYRTQTIADIVEKYNRLKSLDENAQRYIERFNAVQKAFGIPDDVPLEWKIALTHAKEYSPIARIDAAKQFVDVLGRKYEAPEAVKRMAERRANEKLNRVRTYIKNEEILRLADKAHALGIDENIILLLLKRGDVNNFKRIIDIYERKSRDLASNISALQNKALERSSRMMDIAADRALSDNILKGENFFKAVGDETGTAHPVLNDIFDSMKGGLSYLNTILSMSQEQGPRGEAIRKMHDSVRELSATMTALSKKQRDFVTKWEPEVLKGVELGAIKSQVADANYKPFDIYNVEHWIGLAGGNRELGKKMFLAATELQKINRDIISKILKELNNQMMRILIRNGITPEAYRSITEGTASPELMAAFERLMKTNPDLLRINAYKNAIFPHLQVLEYRIPMSLKRSGEYLVDIHKTMDESSPRLWTEGYETMEDAQKRVSELENLIRSGSTITEPYTGASLKLTPDMMVAARPRIEVNPAQRREYAIISNVYDDILEMIESMKPYATPEEMKFYAAIENNVKSLSDRSSVFGWLRSKEYIPGYFVTNDIKGSMFNILNVQSNLGYRGAINKLRESYENIMNDIVRPLEMSNSLEDRVAARNIKKVMTAYLAHVLGGNDPLAVKVNRFLSDLVNFYYLGFKLTTARANAITPMIYGPEQIYEEYGIPRVRTFMKEFKNIPKVSNILNGESIDKVIEDPDIRKYIKFYIDSGILDESVIAERNAVQVLLDSGFETETIPLPKKLYFDFMNAAGALMRSSEKFSRLQVLLSLLENLKEDGKLPQFSKEAAYRFADTMDRIVGSSRFLNPTLLELSHIGTGVMGSMASTYFLLRRWSLQMVANLIHTFKTRGIRAGLTKFGGISALGFLWGGLSTLSPFIPDYIEAKYASDSFFDRLVRHGLSQYMPVPVPIPGLAGTVGKAVTGAIAGLGIPAVGSALSGTTLIDRAAGQPSPLSMATPGGLVELVDPRQSPAISLVFDKIPKKLERIHAGITGQPGSRNINVPLEMTELLTPTAFSAGVRQFVENENRRGEPFPDLRSRALTSLYRSAGYGLKDDDISRLADEIYRQFLVKVPSKRVHREGTGNVYMPVLSPDDLRRIREIIELKIRKGMK